jgi:S1-C subfamily serine protease
MFARMRWPLLGLFVIWLGACELLADGGGPPVQPTAAPTKPAIAAPPKPAGAPATTATPAQAAVKPTVVPLNQAQPQAQPQPGGGADSLVAAIRRVADARKPSVVLIASLAGEIGAGTQPGGDGQGVGSGAIIDPAGFIVTNNHVVEGAQALRVVLPDNRTFEGRLVGRDPQTDLAVVKIDGENLPVAPLAPSLNVAVGDWVVAIGNALGLPGGPTVTAGVVGALGRTITEPNGVALEDMIQTDAAINPGNSGGPLLNLNGEIVGVNTAGIQGAAGLGFAVSIDTVREVVPQLIQNGRVIRPFIGISTVEITPGVAARNNLPRQDGLGIVRVGDGTPAQRAGLREGDIIIAADGQPVKTQRDLRGVLSNHKPGDTLILTVQRGNSQGEARVTLAEAPRPS